MIEQISARRVVVDVALAHTWVREVGSNRGQAVEAILRRCFLPPGEPWCAAFVSYIGRATLGNRWPLPMTGRCSTLGEIAEAKKMLGDYPMYGSIFLLWSDALGRYRHTGFISALSSSEVYTIEGNTSPDGSPEGTGVFERRRTFGPKDRFILWWREP